MDRAFLGLAFGTLLVLLGAVLVGLKVVDQRWLGPHLGLALFGSVLTALVHVVTFTYFTVTGKAVRQAVALAHLDDGLLREVQRFKKGVTRCLAGGMLPLIATIALGADVLRNPAHHDYHLVAALVALGANIAAFAAEFQLIRQNQSLVERVMSEYRQQGPATSKPG